MKNDAPLKNKHQKPTFMDAEKAKDTEEEAGAFGAHADDDEDHTSNSKTADFAGKSASNTANANDSADDDGIVFKKQENKMKIKKKKETKKKPYIIMLTIGLVSLTAGVVLVLLTFLGGSKKAANYNFPDLFSEKKESATEYSPLTGQPLAAGQAANSPTYCVQTPNGTDGARPQAGLTQAGVIFEAIAEAGITRFAAIYQNPTSAVIGPIRSLRIYYLQWDTPFDCTIVHAGGSADALAAVSRGYKDLTEDYKYMYRGGYTARRWNNLFTTSDYLRQFSTDTGTTTSNVTGLARMTPEESARSRVDASASEALDITKPATSNTSELAAKVSSIALRFGGWADFNVNYTYDEKTNTYLRSYESGAPHEVYSCPEASLGEVDPENKCTLTQMAPSVVVAMMVDERRASDNYHEDITAIGSGKAYIFQNGTAVEGTWAKAATDTQIVFKDASGNEIKLAPGQTFISAVPNYGSVAY
ncbi:DUF3048 domain-containing protein [Candidatus Saccharibacteria bacterium]|nr:DUF3048 domain-containing protein [Candidatus Saccharibacteria bacterium]